MNITVPKSYIYQVRGMAFLNTPMSKARIFVLQRKITGENQEGYQLSHEYKFSRLIEHEIKGLWIFEKMFNKSSNFLPEIISLTISGVGEFLKQMPGIHEFLGIEGHSDCKGMDTCLRRYDEHLHEKLPDPSTISGH